MPSTVFLVVGFVCFVFVYVFSFSSLNISCNSILACKVSAEVSADSLMGVPSNVTLCFPLLPLKFSIFKFCHFNYDMFWCGSLWVHFVWDSLCFLDLDMFLFPGYGSFQPLFHQTHCPFLSLLLNSYNANVSTLDVVPKVP